MLWSEAAGAQRRDVRHTHGTGRNAVTYSEWRGNKCHMCWGTGWPRKGWGSWRRHHGYFGLPMWSPLGPPQRWQFSRSAWRFRCTWILPIHYDHTFLKGSRILGPNLLVANPVQTWGNLLKPHRQSRASTSCEIQSVVLSCLLLWGCGVFIKTDKCWFWFSPRSLPLPSKDTFFWDGEWDADQPGLRDLSVRHSGREWGHSFHAVSSHTNGTATRHNHWSEE